MQEKINIYCDESCHLSYETGPMALGAVVVNMTQAYLHNEAIRKIKQNHGIPVTRELKWTKVSPAKSAVYEDIINYFFEQPDLSFRAILIPNKSMLNHFFVGKTYDDLYYEIYFHLLQNVIAVNCQNRVFIDIKDTQSKIKIKKLHEALCNDKYDFDHKIVSQIQTIRSHEVELMAVVDLFIGALTYFHRNISTSQTKLQLIKMIQEKSKLSLRRSSLLTDKKFNLFVWHPEEVF
jgi:hypothetical protein